eukprot:CAMPEP_0178417552 /NCGR_PEP_ID=MMETSP0689_2-20121128/24631_1 /TAXON_ID=160604 /ORGANISM="Amphidinium massartii, Strain CS-259" /LENGTH=195 /DNA_ID=CAMNT_0020038917 /DNA_START=38 /DNA_END=621 /DNA_ORIENTATION=-
MSMLQAPALAQAHDDLSILGSCQRLWQGFSCRLVVGTADMQLVQGSPIQHLRDSDHQADQIFWRSWWRWKAASLQLTPTTPSLAHRSRVLECSVIASKSASRRCSVTAQYSEDLVANTPQDQAKNLLRGRGIGWRCRTEPAAGLSEATPRDSHSGLGLALMLVPLPCRELSKPFSGPCRSPETHGSAQGLAHSSA